MIFRILKRIVKYSLIFVSFLILLFILFLIVVNLYIEVVHIHPEWSRFRELIIPGTKISELSDGDSVQMRVHWSGHYLKRKDTIQILRDGDDFKLTLTGESIFPGGYYGPPRCPKIAKKELTLSSKEIREFDDWLSYMRRLDILNFSPNCRMTGWQTDVLWGSSGKIENLGPDGCSDPISDSLLPKMINDICISEGAQSQASPAKSE